MGLGPLSRRPPAPRPRRERARTLLFIAACFVGSAVVRVGEVGTAVAQNAPVGGFEPTVLPDSGPARSGQAGDGPACACDEDPGPLLEAIRARDAALREREDALAEREGMVRLAQSRVREEIARLEQIEQALAETMAMADGAAERDVEHLVGVYETMKPKDAAEVFGEMAPGFAAGFLARMRRESAGAIIAAMEPNAAYAVTAIMAGRNVGAGVGVDPTALPTAARLRPEDG